LGQRIAAAHAPVFVCANGTLLPSKYSKFFMGTTDWRDYHNRVVTREDGLLLPTCRNFDTMLAQPPLALALNEDQLIALARAESQGVVAATIFGPPQEKTRNEDFALAAVIVDRNNVSHAFAVVADGVTSKTFWAERAARLACFVALQVAIDYLDGSADYSMNDIEIVRQALCEQLRRTLQFDRQWILEQGATPPEWDPASFKKFSDNEAFWYNTTLLISLVGPKGGMLLWSGDGSIHIKKHFEKGRIETTSPLRSTDDVNVANVISLGGPILFSGGRLDTLGSLDGVTVTLCTDGADRTVQRNGDQAEVLDVSDSASVAAVLEGLARLPNHEIDNYSAAVLRWPIPPAKSIPIETVDHLLWPPVISSYIAGERNSNQPDPRAKQIEPVAAVLAKPRRIQLLV
jgi:hypothetical protein